MLKNDFQKKEGVFMIWLGFIIGFVVGVLGHNHTTKEKMNKVANLEEFKKMY